MEKLIAKQIWEYLNANKILDKYYSGFRKNHSTETALTYITDEILTNMGNRLVTPTVLMDLSKAFDSIDHSMMLTKLFNYGFDCHAVFWFASYLRNRPQIVKVNSVISDQESLKCGVPQGSVLGPVLFVLYINEIPAIVAKYVQNSTSEVSIHGYADDLQLFSSCTTQSLEACILNLEQCCKTILDWFSQNKLKANPDKFQFIIYGTIRWPIAAIQKSLIHYKYFEMNTGISDLIQNHNIPHTKDGSLNRRINSTAVKE